MTTIENWNILAYIYMNRLINIRIYIHDIIYYISWHVGCEVQAICRNGDSDSNPNGRGPNGSWNPERIRRTPSATGTFGTQASPHGDIVGTSLGHRCIHRIVTFLLLQRCCFSERHPKTSKQLGFEFWRRWRLGGDTWASENHRWVELSPGLWLIDVNSVSVLYWTVM